MTANPIMIPAAIMGRSKLPRSLKKIPSTGLRARAAAPAVRDSLTSGR